MDLFHRLNDYRINLPPLRERGDDLHLLCEQFLGRMTDDLDKEVQGISPEAAAVLTAHTWPGNVRELKTVLRKAVLRATGPTLVPEFLPASVRAGSTHRVVADESIDDSLPVSDLRQFVDGRVRAGSNELYDESLQMMETYLLTRVLQESDGNQSKAAERLGISRGSLRFKIRALGISIEQVVQSD